MKKARPAIPNQRLREARKQHYYTQSQVAERLGTTVVNVNRWESGTTVPSLYFRQKLCELFAKSPEELGLIPETDRQEQTLVDSSTSRPKVWNVPFRRNPYFTGRQDVLRRLEAVLQTGNAAALVQAQAISGLGGIGKTQTAVEYAYRHQNKYQAVLWARADSHDLLIADFVNLASVLNVPEKDEQDENQLLGAVKGWLKDYSDWLLILDNVEDVKLASDFLPLDSKGHILLTTRTQSTGTVAQRIELEKLEPEEGALLLLRRAKLLASELSFEQAASNDRVKALELAQLLDGLPLALDQAAAYIEETDCGLSGYLERYQTRRAKLLHLRGSAASNHPESVATTWSLSFEKVQQANPAAADLIRLCAFLHPDAIPEEIITKGAVELEPALEPIADDPLELDAAIRELRKYSLIRRDPEAHLLQVHRLVQAVVRDGMEERTQREWAERVVHALSKIFPYAEFTTWSLCERYLPQAQICATLIQQGSMSFPEAALLLHKTGDYLLERARYSEVQPFLQQALSLREQCLGPNHPQTAETLDRLAWLYENQGKYPEAELLYQRGLAIREQQLGADHPDTASSLDNLAGLYYAQGKYSEAEELFRRSLAINELQLGAQHPETLTNLNNLAMAYYAQGKYSEAEPLHQRALNIREQQLGPQHPHTAISISNLGMLYYAQGKYSEAEELFRRSLTIREQQLEADHPDTANSLSQLAMAYYAQGKYSEAEPLHRRALEIRERQCGPDHPDTANSLNTLGMLYYAQGRYSEAEELYQRALTIRERQLGPHHPLVAQSLHNLANLRHEQGKDKEAEALMQQALTIREQALGAEHPDTAETMQGFADLRKARGDNEGARTWYMCALAVRVQALGVGHPKTLETRSKLIALLHTMGQHGKAAELEVVQLEHGIAEDLSS